MREMEMRLLIGLIWKRADEVFISGCRSAPSHFYLGVEGIFPFLLLLFFDGYFMIWAGKTEVEIVHRETEAHLYLRTQKHCSCLFVPARISQWFCLLAPAALWCTSSLIE
jgi:hypothetical protein